MAVRVRLFASAREAAGTGETTVAARAVDDVLAELERRYGPRFSRVLAISTVLLDGSAVPRGSGAEVADGAEIAVIPPVSGGSGGLQPLGGDSGAPP